MSARRVISHPEKRQLWKSKLALRQDPQHLSQVHVETVPCDRGSHQVHGHEALESPKWRLAQFIPAPDAQNGIDVDKHGFESGHFDV